MKNFRLLLHILGFFISINAFSQSLWKKIERNNEIAEDRLEYRSSKPISYSLFTFDKSKFENKIRVENSVIELPTPNGLQRFKIKEASVFSKELAAKYPSIKSYVGYGIDDQTARARISKSKVGIHIMISSGNYPLYLIDPYTKDKKTAITYFKKNSKRAHFSCLVEESIAPIKKTISKTTSAGDGKLRTYRLALVATGAYSQFHLGKQGVGAGESDATKKAAVLSAINTSITRINGIFERDLSITMQLVSNNENLIFLDESTDGLTDGNATTLISEVQSKIDNVIGNTNYDVGHAFGKHSNGNGLAAFQSACNPLEKGQGVSILDTPIDDGFDLDVSAHEFGHQFGANHTQNSDCNRNSATAVEPGSGTTIMGYAGWCWETNSNVQNNSDAYFHAVSIAEMWSYVSGTSCAVETSTGNTAPSANAGSNFTIPKSTPFVLTGSATDADVGNSLTYTWEQIDNEVATMPLSSSNTVGPLFRSAIPSVSSSRHFPKLATVLAGNTSTTWEVLPSVPRTMEFAFTVRDNVTNGGATDRDDMIVTVDGNSGPFVVTSQSTNTTLNGSSTQTVTWNVANTSAAPVSCANVNILLSTDGGLTYPHVLVSNTPNDGTQDVTLTNETTSQARIKIEAVGNIFYAVNSTNFSIDKTTGVEDNLFANFKMYPNPSKGSVLISFDAISSNDVSIQLFDIRGRMIDVKQYKITSSTFQKEMNYQSVAKGIYILKITNGQNRLSKKIILE